jgi:hypothetical protein
MLFKLLRRIDMHLQEAYQHRSEEYSPEVQEALRIAYEVYQMSFPPIEDVVEVLKRIPQSEKYFTHLENGEYGYEIRILVPQEVESIPID